MINEKPTVKTDLEAARLLYEAALTAYTFLELYCVCTGAKGVVAKDLRRALEATQPLCKPKP